MTQAKKYWPLIIIAVVIIFAGAIILAKQQSAMILFYSDSCSHCQIVEKYITDNGIDAKLDFQKKEVSRSQANATLLERKARQCGLDVTQGLSVPFFFDGSRCYAGDQEIIAYFNTK